MHTLLLILALILALGFFWFCHLRSPTVEEPFSRAASSLKTDAEHITDLIQEIAVREADIFNNLMPVAEKYKTTIHTWTFDFGESFGVVSDTSLAALREAIHWHKVLMKDLHQLVHVCENLPEDFEVFYRDSYSPMLKRLEALYQPC